MRWEALFADLEGQARALESEERTSEIADRTRGELAQVALLARLHRQLGGPLRLGVEGPGDVSGRLERIGADWLLVTGSDETLVSLAAISVVRGLPPTSTAPDAIPAVQARTRLTPVLRAVARDRSSVAVTTRAGDRLTGTPDRVGADWFDLVLHDADAGPRQHRDLNRATVPFSMLATVRRDRSGWL